MCFRFRHNDARHAGALLDEHRARHPHALIVTEGVFSMDGDRAPLDELARIARRTDAWLMVDDAHAIGVINEGRGSIIANGAGANLLQMGTLSKAIGAYGGYLCASRPVDRSHSQPRAHVCLCDRIAAGDRCRRHRGTRSDRARARLRCAPPRQGQSVHAARRDSPRRKARSCPWSSAGPRRRWRRPGFWRTKDSWWSRSGRRRCRKAPRGCGSPLRPAHPDAEIERLADLVRTKILAR